MTSPSAVATRSSNGEMFSCRPGTIIRCLKPRSTSNRRSSVSVACMGGSLPDDVVKQPVILRDGQVAVLRLVDLVQLVQLNFPLPAEGLQLTVEMLDGEAGQPPD